MVKELEKVAQAKKSFNHMLDNKKYANIIRDDKHLSVLMQLLEGGEYSNILDIGTGTGYFPDVADAVSQMSKLLVKGGKVLLSDPMRNESDGNMIFEKSNKS